MQRNFCGEFGLVRGWCVDAVRCTVAETSLQAGTHGRAGVYPVVATSAPLSESCFLHTVPIVPRNLLTPPSFPQSETFGKVFSGTTCAAPSTRVPSRARGWGGSRSVSKECRVGAVRTMISSRGPAPPPRPPPPETAALTTTRSLWHACVSMCACACLSGGGRVTCGSRGGASGPLRRRRLVALNNLPGGRQRRMRKVRDGRARTQTTRGVRLIPTLTWFGHVRAAGL